MTSLKQIEANRRNSRKSTGPTSEEGKRASRLNAMRHGLCAETVVELLEDVEDYKGFEAAIIADYDAQTAVERELVLRLASLLWRIRRAASIETELLGIQAQILRDRRYPCGPRYPPEGTQNAIDHVLRVMAAPELGSGTAVGSHNGTSGPVPSELYDHPPRSATRPVSPARELAHCFERLANLDNGVFERLTRYEAALWRQVAQTIFLLRSTGQRWR